MPASVLGPRPPRRPLSAGSRTVLLVEDETPVRELVAAILQREGYAIIKARHSTEAALFNQEFPGEIHLLLTDLCMSPHPNGRQLAVQVRASRPGIAVLYISGFADDPEMAREVAKGAALFLPKPFRPEALVHSVRLALSRLAPAA